MPANIRRRALLRSGLTGVGALTLPRPITAAEGDPVDRLEDYDDAGNPLDPGPAVERFRTASSLPVNPPDPPDGTIASPTFAWLEAGSPMSDGDVALRLADRGGVEPNFRPSTAGDLAVAFDWRFAGGDALAYAFNDRDSLSGGFRAFTNGIADAGFVFRNPFGGRDVAYGGDLQDGAWHRIVVVLDAADNRFRAYVDGRLVGAAFYDGTGWTATDRLRVMGRLSGSSTQVDYDRFVVVPAALGPGEPITAEPLIRYDIEAGRGTVLRNGPGAPGHGLVAAKEALIDDVRAAAAGLLPLPLADGMDQEAERLLTELAPSISGGDDPVTLEAADRMVIAEGVTAVGTAAGIEPVEETARTVGELAFAIAAMGAGKLLLRGTTRGGRWFASRLGYAERQARRAFDDLVGGPTLPPAARRDIDERFERATRDVKTVMAEHTDTLEAAGETAASAGLVEGLKRLPEEVIDALESIRDALVSFFAFLLYSRYLFQRGQVDETGQRIQPPGVDPAIDEHMRELRGFVEAGSLSPAGRAGRVAERDRTIDAITARSEDAVSFLRTNRVVVGTLGTFSLFAVGAGLVAKAIAALLAASGIGLGPAAVAAGFGAQFIVFGGALGALSGALAGAGVLYGRGTLDDLSGRHHAGTSAIVRDGV